MLHKSRHRSGNRTIRRRISRIVCPLKIKIENRKQKLIFFYYLKLALS